MEVQFGRNSDGTPGVFDAQGEWHALEEATVDQLAPLVAACEDAELLEAVGGSDGRKTFHALVEKRLAELAEEEEGEEDEAEDADGTSALQGDDEEDADEGVRAPSEEQRAWDRLPKVRILKDFTLEASGRSFEAGTVVEGVQDEALLEVARAGGFAELIPPPDDAGGVQPATGGPMTRAERDRPIRVLRPFTLDAARERSYEAGEVLDPPHTSAHLLEVARGGAFAEFVTE